MRDRFRRRCMWDGKPFSLVPTVTGVSDHLFCSGECALASMQARERGTWFEEQQAAIAARQEAGSVRTEVARRARDGVRRRRNHKK